MKKFFKKLLTVLGVLMLVLIVAILVGIIVVGKKLNSNEIKCTNCVLEISIDNGLSERKINANLISKLSNENQAVSYREALEIINEACTDKSIKAISINGASSMAQTHAVELSQALVEFKENCDKKIYAFGDYYSQNGYLLASQADSTFIHPMGSVNLKGFKAVFTYFKDFFDRWDIDMAIYKAGKYKSYTESYTQSEPSQENREQYQEILNDLENTLFNKLTKWKGKDQDFWKDVVQNDFGARAQKALDYGLIDAVSYESDYINRLKTTYGENMELVPLEKYLTKVKNRAKANVAYLALEGAITVKGDEISSHRLKAVLKKIRESEEYKAVIIRMCSGGGSAFASEDIWHEIKLLKEKGIPVITSIGRVAASGGYYVVANSDKIFAQENSIVGSIGVFIMIPQFQDALKNHVGIDFAEISNSPYSSPSPFIDLNDEMKQKLQEDTDFIYETFLTRVAEGRNLDMEDVKKLAQGRIYAGKKSQELGLIDGIKSLEEVIEYVKTTYELDYVALEEFPKIQEELIPKDISDLNIKTSISHPTVKSKLSEIESLIQTSLELEPRMEFIGVEIK